MKQEIRLVVAGEKTRGEWEYKTMIYRTEQQGDFSIMKRVELVYWGILTEKEYRKLLAAKLNYIEKTGENRFRLEFDLTGSIEIKKIQKILEDLNKEVLTTMFKENLAPIQL